MCNEQFVDPTAKILFAHLLLLMLTGWEGAEKNDLRVTIGEKEMFTPDINIKMEK